jgi:nitrite reductase/ring-hydroxylating ferredoxin subunit
MADALSKQDPTIWRLRPRAPLPGTVLGPLEEIPDGAAKEYIFGRGITVFSMFVVRRGTTVFGYLNICPHYSSPLNHRKGEFLNEDGSRIRCTMHFAEFRIEDGHGVSGAAEGCWLDPVPVRVDNGMIMIDDVGPHPLSCQ